MCHVTPTDQENAMTQNPNTETVTTDDAELVTEDLIEEVSIDGMCGVY
jgi:mycofactocin precursor